jgi:hypothetical protein
MEEEWVLVEEQFVHDDTQGEYIIFMVVGLAAFVVFRSAIRHGESRLMIYK